MDILKTTLLGLFFGTFGTTIGGILGVDIKKQSNIKNYKKYHKIKKCILKFKKAGSKYESAFLNKF